MAFQEIQEPQKKEKGTTRGQRITQTLYGLSQSVELQPSTISRIPGFSSLSGFSDLARVTGFSSRPLSSTPSDLIVRVRQVIPFLDYTNLVRVGAIPDLIKEMPKLPNNRYPAWIYARAKVDPETFSLFGLFMEEIVFESSLISAPPRLSDDTLARLWQQFFEGPVPSDVTKSRNYFNKIYSVYRQAFAQSDERDVEHNPELSVGHISGHPDLMTSDWILEVKTTTGFAKMAEEASLQLLCYWMLARLNGHNPRVAGFAFPVQQEIIWFDLNEWNYNFFYHILTQNIKWISDDIQIFNPEVILSRLPPNPEYLPSGQIDLGLNLVGVPAPVFRSRYLGSHVHKQSEYPKHIPIQIFLCSPQGGEDSGYLSPEEVTQLNEKCQGCQVYVHAPYTINLCSSQSWTLNRLRDQLKYSRAIGCQGVVVHVGKSKDENVDVAKRTMIAGIRSCLSEATIPCPLIIETPAGQGSELYPTIEEMIEFYSNFTPEEKKVLKICVDTCHVFVAGYDPAYYLKHLLKSHPNSVVLVHFNDSNEPRGAHHDNHYAPGLGFIGYPRLEKVQRICLREYIAMVRE